jgi:GMP synthase (glutamine-hydrolysing)
MVQPTRRLLAVQHSQSEHLGLLEHHLEARGIAFHYCRPFMSVSQIPGDASGYDGLILLPGGQYGVTGNPILLTMPTEVELARRFLDDGKPVIGFGAGALLLAMAAGGDVAEGPWRFALARIAWTGAAGAIPAGTTMPLLVSHRDRPVLPADARVLAREADGTPAVFRAGGGIGFTGHPAATGGMYEDLVMEVLHAPDDSGEVLTALRAAQSEVAAALSAIAGNLLAEAGPFPGSER